MPVFMPNPEAGKRLKAARIRVHLSTREVERLSQKLAQEKNQDYYISHAWLSEAESGKFTPSIYKLYSLSVIYKCGYDEILSWFDIHLTDIDRDQMWLTLPHTHLIGTQSSGIASLLDISPEVKRDIQFDKTNLVSRMFGKWGGMPVSLLARASQRNSLYGYVGTLGFTLFPFIRPGSFVEIDGSQKKIERARWSSEHDRPIYFIELRDSYACSWCELTERQLLLVPSPQSGSPIRQVRFPGEAEIVGRVTAVSLRIAAMQAKTR